MSKHSSTIKQGLKMLNVKCSLCLAHVQRETVELVLNVVTCKMKHKVRNIFANVVLFYTYRRRYKCVAAEVEINVTPGYVKVRTVYIRVHVPCGEMSVEPASRDGDRNKPRVSKRRRRRGRLRTSISCWTVQRRHLSLTAQRSVRPTSLINDGHSNVNPGQTRPHASHCVTIEF